MTTAYLQKSKWQQDVSERLLIKSIKLFNEHKVNGISMPIFNIRTNRNGASLENNSWYKSGSGGKLQYVLVPLSETSLYTESYLSDMSIGVDSFSDENDKELHFSIADNAPYAKQVIDFLTLKGYKKVNKRDPRSRSYFELTRFTNEDLMEFAYEKFMREIWPNIWFIVFDIEPSSLISLSTMKKRFILLNEFRNGSYSSVF